MSKRISSAIRDNHGRGTVGDFLKVYRNINRVLTAYCLHCRVVTNLSVSITLVTVTDSDGQAQTVASRTYHCESCGSFVRSEEDTIPGLGDILCYGP
jgi:hypothetical protein